MSMIIIGIHLIMGIIHFGGMERGIRIIDTDIIPIHIIEIVATGDSQ